CVAEPGASEAEGHPPRGPPTKEAENGVHARDHRLLPGLPSRPRCRDRCVLVSRGCRPGSRATLGPVLGHHDWRACRPVGAGSIGTGESMTPHAESASSGAAGARVFVGRDEELGALRAGLERAVAGRGSVYLVTGEPGIGKTELVDRLAGDAL